MYGKTRCEAHFPFSSLSNAGSLDLKDQTSWTTIERDGQGEMVTSALEKVSSSDVLANLTVTGLEGTGEKECFVFKYVSATKTFAGNPVGFDLKNP